MDAWWTGAVRDRYGASDSFRHSNIDGLLLGEVQNRRAHLVVSSVPAIRCLDKSLTHSQRLLELPFCLQRLQ